MTTLLCAGPRTWTSMDQEVALWRALEKFSENYGLHEIVVGDARGADAIVREFAKSRPEVMLSVFRANWDAEGKGAGPKRNKRMVDYVVGQAVEHGTHVIHGLVCHARSRQYDMNGATWVDEFTPGTAWTYRLLKQAGSVVPVLITHVTIDTRYEEAVAS